MYVCVCAQEDKLDDIISLFAVTWNMGMHVMTVSCVCARVCVCMYVYVHVCM